MEEKELIKLKREGWHYKLQKFILKDGMPDLYNFCPYFWLTIFCIIVLPFMAPVRFLIWLLECYDKYILEPRFQKWVKNMKDETAYNLQMGNKVLKPTRWFENKKYKEDAFSLWLKHKGWSYSREADIKTIDEFFRKIREKLELDEQKEKKKKEQNKYKKLEKEARRRALRQKFALNYPNIVKWTKRFVGLIITLIGTVILFFVVGYTGRGICWLIDNWNWYYFWCIIASFGIVGIFIGLIYLIDSYVKYIKRRYQEDKHIPLYARLFYKIICLPIYYITAKPIIWIALLIWNFIGDIYGIFREYLGAAYGDYCPGIKWSDEDNY